MNRPRASFLLLLAALAGPLSAQEQPRWLLGTGVGDSLAALWEGSVAARLERVACLGGVIGTDTVHVSRVLPLPGTPSDSLTADPAESLSACGPPEWIGTIHTHVRSTDDERPATRFSPGDRAVMAEWVRRWRQAGAFCLLHSDRAMHCEVWPPGSTQVLPR